MNTCWCGCGEVVARYYVSGHDQRHLQAVIRTHPDQADALLQFPTQAMRNRYLDEIEKRKYWMTDRYLNNYVKNDIEKRK